MIQMTDKPVLNGLFRNQPDTPEDKYLVKRRDGSVVEWPNFVLGAKDPAAIYALRMYAWKARALGYAEGFCQAVECEADHWEAYRAQHGNGDPDCGKHREDDPATVAEMRKGRSA
jgi:hypothetical protein